MSPVLARSPSVPGSHRRPSGGFTLTEVMIVASIIIVLATVGMTKYRSALRISRLEKAKQELRVIAFEIDMFHTRYGTYPETLADVKYDRQRDPWGNPYMYLNFQEGTGNALDFLLAGGLIDPNAAPSSGGMPAVADGGNGGDGGQKKKKDHDGDDDDDDDDDEVAAEEEGGDDDEDDDDEGDVAGKVEAAKRKDAFLFPLNTDYDLFCLGPNGKAWASISHELSLDDVIRANDGEYFGLASNY